MKGENFTLNMTAAGVRKPLIVLGDMLNKGWDLHFHSTGTYYAIHPDGEILSFRREGNRFRLDAEVVLPDGAQTSAFQRRD